MGTVLTNDRKQGGFESRRHGRNLETSEWSEGGRGEVCVCGGGGEQTIIRGGKLGMGLISSPYITSLNDA